MHELSIAGALVDIAQRHAEGRRVARVEVSVGHLRQVVPDVLAFAFELCAQGTVVERAELVLTEVPAAGVCRHCGAQTPLPAFPWACAACGSADVELTGGEELQVDALELEDFEAAATTGGTP
jgi:hydrogenase nickel incorporation protein HypA/HybF